MSWIVRVVIIVSFVIHPAARAELTSQFLGVGTSVLVHELGHALTARALNWKVSHFRPFPGKMPTKDGQSKWVLGYVLSDPPPDLDPNLRIQEEALMLAMGSGTQVLAVLALAPLLPATYGYGSQVLDSFLVFSAVNWPLYVISDIYYGPTGAGDWRRVAQHTGISIYWYLAASVATSAGLLYYLDQQRKQAMDHGRPEGRLLANVYSVTF